MKNVVFYRKTEALHDISIPAFFIYLHFKFLCSKQSLNLVILWMYSRNAWPFSKRCAWIGCERYLADACMHGLSFRGS
jgi:hypothetical protein